jgi:hypothetical protein
MQHAKEGRAMLCVLVGKSGGNRSLVIPRHRWEENTSITMDLRETGRGKRLEPSKSG